MDDSQPKGSKFEGTRYVFHNEALKAILFRTKKQVVAGIKRELCTNDLYS